jgi:hypothetical protein
MTRTTNLTDITELTDSELDALLGIEDEDEMIIITPEQAAEWREEWAAKEAANRNHNSYINAARWMTSPDCEGAILRRDERNACYWL